MLCAVNIRRSRNEDFDSLLDLYRRVSRTPGGLARLEEEIDEVYVGNFLSKSISRGLGFVAELPDHTIIGEIHAYPPELFCFSHVLSELTIAVDPMHQSSGVGRKIFERLMLEVESDAAFARVELIARESNQRAISFYETLGFVREGEFKNRIRNTDGTLESDVPMAWIRT